MSATALRRGPSTQPVEEISRLLECVVCRALVRLYEVPSRWISETTFRCGECLLSEVEPWPEDQRP